MIALDHLKETNREGASLIRRLAFCGDRQCRTHLAYSSCWSSRFAGVFAFLSVPLWFVAEGLVFSVTKLLHDQQAKTDELAKQVAELQSQIGEHKEDELVGRAAKMARLLLLVRDRLVCSLKAEPFTDCKPVSNSRSGQAVQIRVCAVISVVEEAATK